MNFDIPNLCILNYGLPSNIIHNSSLQTHQTSVRISSNPSICGEITTSVTHLPDIFCLIYPAHRAQVSYSAWNIQMPEPIAWNACITIHRKYVKVKIQGLYNIVNYIYLKRAPRTCPSGSKRRKWHSTDLIGEQWCKIGTIRYMSWWYKILWLRNKCWQKKII